MTDMEKTEIRSRAIARFLQAVDGRKAHCGLLAERVGRLRDVVRWHDEHALHVAGAPGREVFGDDEHAGFVLPSHQEVVAAFVDCQKARAEEQRLLVEALNAGVSREVLAAAATPK